MAELLNSNTPCNFTNGAFPSVVIRAGATGSVLNGVTMVGAFNGNDQQVYNMAGSSTASVTLANNATATVVGAADTFVAVNGNNLFVPSVQSPVDAGGFVGANTGLVTAQAGVVAVANTTVVTYSVTVRNVSLVNSDNVVVGVSINGAAPAAGTQTAPAVAPPTNVANQTYLTVNKLCVIGAIAATNTIGLQIENTSNADNLVVVSASMTVSHF